MTPTPDDLQLDVKALLAGCSLALDTKLDSYLDCPSFRLIAGLCRRTLAAESQVEVLTSSLEKVNQEVDELRRTVMQMMEEERE